MDAPNVLITAAYPQIKAQHPTEGRRQWKIRAVEAIWASSNSAEEIVAKSEEVKRTQTLQGLPWLADKDPLDLEDGDANGIVNAKGVIVRTDFSNDAAWGEFVKKVEEAEREGVLGMSAQPEGEGEDEGDDSESSEEEEEEVETMDVDNAAASTSTSAPTIPSIFHIINPPPTSPLHSALQNASNIALLRLFNDVQIARAPPKPRAPPGDLFSGMPKKKKDAVPPPTGAKGENNRLVDRFGWKEVYPGRILWVYDAESNATGSVRVVNSGDDAAYGSSTGDSWRARAGHIWELQVNMDSGALKIDFGGEDRWTGKERVRNYEDVAIGNVRV